MFMFVSAVSLWYFYVFIPEDKSRIYHEQALRTDVELLFMAVSTAKHTWVQADRLFTFHDCNREQDARKLRREALAWARGIARKEEGKLCWVSLPHLYIGTSGGHSALYLRMSFYVERMYEQID